MRRNASQGLALALRSVDVVAEVKTSTVVASGRGPVRIAHLLVTPPLGRIL